MTVYVYAFPILPAKREGNVIDPKSIVFTGPFLTGRGGKREKTSPRGSKRGNKFPIYPYETHIKGNISICYESNLNKPACQKPGLKKERMKS